MKTDLDLNIDPHDNHYNLQEQVNFGYSMKNIPVCSKEQFIKSLINKTEIFIKIFDGEHSSFLIQAWINHL